MFTVKDEYGEKNQGPVIKNRDSNKFRVEIESRVYGRDQWGIRIYLKGIRDQVMIQVKEVT